VSRINHRDKPIVITGVGGGIGSTLVNCLIEEFGYTCIISVARSSAAIRRRDYFRVIDSHPILRDTIAHEVGSPVWGLINLAGKEHAAVTFKENFAAAANDAFSDNAGTVVEMCGAFLPQMRVAGGGRIVNVSSVVAHRPTFGAGAYGASKAWVEGFTRALAYEVAPKKITANCIALGYFRAANGGMFERLNRVAQETITAQIPVGRPGEVDEIAALVDYMLSDGGAYMTGQTLHLNGGLYA